MSQHFAHVVVWGQWEKKNGNKTDALLRFAFPAFVVVVALGIEVSVWQARREASASLPIQPGEEKIAPPSPAPAPTQQLHTSSEYHSCVLSYATEDQTFAEKLSLPAPSPVLRTPMPTRRHMFHTQKARVPLRREHAFHTFALDRSRYPRTGERSRQFDIPLYRLLEVLIFLWLSFPPNVQLFHFSG